jgi:hypothetical protein
MQDLFPTDPHQQCQGALRLHMEAGIQRRCTWLSCSVQKQCPPTSTSTPFHPSE